MARYTIVVALLALLSVTRAMTVASPLENNFNSDDVPKKVVAPSTIADNAMNKVAPPLETEDGPIVTIPDPSQFGAAPSGIYYNWRARGGCADWTPDACTAQCNKEGRPVPPRLTVPGRRCVGINAFSWIGRCPSGQTYCECECRLTAEGGDDMWKADDRECQPKGVSC